MRRLSRSEARWGLVKCASRTFDCPLCFQGGESVFAVGQVIDVRQGLVWRKRRLESRVVEGFRRCLSGLARGFGHLHRSVARIALWRGFVNHVRSRVHGPGSGNVQDVRAG